MIPFHFHSHSQLHVVDLDLAIFGISCAAGYVLSPSDCENNLVACNLNPQVPLTLKLGILWSTTDETMFTTSTVVTSDEMLQKS